MVIKLISTSSDKFPCCGFFIEGSALEIWLDELNDLNLDPDKLELYALPSLVANSIWGCLVITNESNLPHDLGRWTGAHKISNRLIVPEKTDITPELTPYDFNILLADDRYVFHMDIGMFKLENPFQLADHIEVSKIDIVNTTKPVSYSRIDHSIPSFRIEATPAEDLKAELDAIPNREKLKDQPLGFGEKVKLEMYKTLLKVNKGPDGKVIVEKPAVSVLEKLAAALGISTAGVKDRIVKDFEDLMERNRKEAEKLMDLLEKNPEDALKYAIPLDEHGYSRGAQGADFKMQNRGSDFSLFRKLGGSSTGGRGVDLGDEYYKLENQYRRTAEALIRKGDYEKAAFVYLKLLKDYAKAAETLRAGRYFEKAAYVYLEYLKDELSAAACYEEGKIYDTAIELYNKNEKLEKVGDLYAIQGKQYKADEMYQKVIDKYVGDSQYIKASMVCKGKLLDMSQTQQLLLTGWTQKSDGYSCLLHYFKNIIDSDEAWDQLNYVKDHLVNTTNENNFLKVVKSEYAIRNTNKGKLREMGYVLISDMLERGIVSSNELHAFNAKDQRLIADTMRYNINRVNRMKG